MGERQTDLIGFLRALKVKIEPWQLPLLVALSPEQKFRLPDRATLNREILRSARKYTARPSTETATDGHVGPNPPR